MLGGPLEGGAKPKNSPKFGDLFSVDEEEKKTSCAIFHSCRVSLVRSFMVSQRTKAF